MILWNRYGFIFAIAIGCVVLWLYMKLWDVIAETISELKPRQHRPQPSEPMLCILCGLEAPCEHLRWGGDQWFVIKDWPAYLAAWKQEGQRK